MMLWPFRGQFASHVQVELGVLFRDFGCLSFKLDNPKHLAHATRSVIDVRSQLMAHIRFFLPALALLAATGLEAQQAAPAGAGPRIAGIVKDAAGAPVPDVEVGVLKDNRVQQYVNTGSDGAFLLTGFTPGTVPLRFRRIGYAMQFLDID